MDDENRLKSISKFRAARAVTSQMLKHPFLKGKIGELEPNIFFGYTDHPLDRNATALITPFTFLTKNAGKKACCVLKASFRKRQGNSLIFSARGYDIYKVLDINSMSEHRYKITGRTRFTPLTLRLDILKAGTYRLRLARGEDVPDNMTPMTVSDISEPGLAVDFKEESDRYVIATSRLKLNIFKERFRIEVLDSSGGIVTETGSQTKNEFPSAFDAFPLGFIRDRKSGHTYGVESFVLFPGEAVYGLGEGFGPVNRVGSAKGMWHIEGYGNTSGRNYKHIPFFMSTQGYGVFINESAPVTFWTGTREVCKNQFAVESDLIDYYFFYGPSFKNILDAYTDLTGKPAVPPKWSFGTWMSRISYFTQDQVIQTARRLREMRFPSDVIHIDTGWFEKDWCCDWKFDRTRFPDPERMFRKAAEMGFHICLWQTPYVMEETALYGEARRRGVLAEMNGPFVFLYVFPAHPIDFSNSEAVAWYKERLKPLIDMGAASIKTDFGEGIEPHMKFKDYGGRQMHNLYPLLYQKAAFEALEEKYGGGGAVLWARSAYAGAQRYPVHWSGDNSSTFENLICSLRGGLSLGLCGFTFWSQDTGGFVGTPDDELYIRWVQLSIFQSHMRFHGSASKFREPWNFSPETQAIVRKYLELRYSLIPYLYTESRIAASCGLPVLRHLVLDFQDDPTVRHIDDQFMCGRSLLVAPVLTRNSLRKIYLPEGAWYDFATGEKFVGPCWIERESDIRTIPVFVRAGAVLPLAAAAQHTGELGIDDMTLMVFPDHEGCAGYEILEGDKHIKIEARLADGMLDVSMNPEPPGLKISAPEQIKTEGVRINSRDIPKD